MSRKVTKGQGTILMVGDLDIDGELPGVHYERIGRVTDIGSFTPEADEIEVTNNDSPKDDQGAWKEYVSGLADGGEVEITLQFHKSDAASVWALFRKDKAFQVIFPDGGVSPSTGSRWEFAGFIKKFGNEVEREKIVTTKLTIKVSGKPIFTAAS